MDDDRATVRSVDRIIAEAVRRRASDIHLQPEGDGYRLRLRIDGLLREAKPPPAGLGERIAARVKLLAGVDVAEHRRPQDGRLQGQDGEGRPVEFRVATCPSIHGEKLVLRLLEQQGPREIEELGMAAEARGALEQALERPEGLILVTGPTGSGKSATLHAALRRLNTAERNICAVEDPVEMEVPGVTQVAVNRRAGLDFSEALRAFLRQDPDVIMVGEIRDLETAEIAVKAAQTGHRVLSTLHTRTAPAAVERLTQLGVAPYDLASSLNLVIAQRLVRRLCPHCQGAGGEGEPAPGCQACPDGYSGRCGIFQALPVTADIAEGILAGESSRELAARAAAAGIEDLYTVGWRLVEAGWTSAAELHRIAAHEALA